MDLGEMSVTFELYVKTGDENWQRAGDYFAMFSKEITQKLQDAGMDMDFSQTVTGHIYDSWSGSFAHLPRVMPAGDGSNCGIVLSRGGDGNRLSRRSRDDYSRYQR